MYTTSFIDPLETHELNQDAFLSRKKFLAFGAHVDTNHHKRQTKEQCCETLRTNAPNTSLVFMDTRIIFQENIHLSYHQQKYGMDGMDA
ncbi:uncharacterized protein LOC118516478 isoform X2 [Anopheles stephensi]|uniref:uncharacterized protein LOC118516478 isoform X2 n=1 Tax=Anopheles stephensi TaxID=30069 RepID=UPI0016588A6F|nr:uncharacterized protein LOC118516478 isoform X2 [Anopheles stephensi]XP_035918299.1 uncharacterized protein LOC118516478 isoform X2 [Anopheles stephensi]